MYRKAALLQHSYFQDFKLPMGFGEFVQSAVVPNVPPIQPEVHIPHPSQQMPYSQAKECRRECQRKE